MSWKRTLSNVTLSAPRYTPFVSAMLPTLPFLKTTPLVCVIPRPALPGSVMPESMWMPSSTRGACTSRTLSLLPAWPRNVTRFVPLISWLPWLPARTVMTAPAAALLYAVCQDAPGATVAPEDGGGGAAAEAPSRRSSSPSRTSSLSGCRRRRRRRSRACSRAARQARERVARSGAVSDPRAGAVVAVARDADVVARPRPRTATDDCETAPSATAGAVGAWVSELAGHAVVDAGPLAIARFEALPAASSACSADGVRRPAREIRVRVARRRGRRHPRAVPVDAVARHTDVVGRRAPRHREGGGRGRSPPGSAAPSAPGCRRRSSRGDHEGGPRGSAPGGVVRVDADGVGRAARQRREGVTGRGCRRDPHAAEVHPVSGDTDVVGRQASQSIPIVDSVVPVASVPSASTAGSCRGMGRSWT